MHGSVAIAKSENSIMQSTDIYDIENKSLKRTAIKINPAAHPDITAILYLLSGRLILISIMNPTIVRRKVDATEISASETPK